MCQGECVKANMSRGMCQGHVSRGMCQGESVKVDVSRGCVKMNIYVYMNIYIYVVYI